MTIVFFTKEGVNKKKNYCNGCNDKKKTFKNTDHFECNFNFPIFSRKRCYVHSEK